MDSPHPHRRYLSSYSNPLGSVGEVTLAWALLVVLCRVRVLRCCSVLLHSTACSVIQEASLPSVHAQYCSGILVQGGFSRMLKKSEIEAKVCLCSVGFPVLLIGTAPTPPGKELASWRTLNVTSLQPLEGSQTALLPSGSLSYLIRTLKTLA